MVKERPSWDDYFLELTDIVAKRSTCMRRHVGAVLVKDERIIATGYNGAPQGLSHCYEAGCLRQEKGIPSGYRYELCRGVHAEQNVLINAARYGVSTLDSVLYCTNQPCILCARMLINAGVRRIVHRGDFEDHLALQFFSEAGVEVLEVPRNRGGSGGD